LDFHTSSIVHLCCVPNKEKLTGKADVISSDSSGKVNFLSFNRLALWWSVDMNTLSSGKDGVLVNIKSLQEDTVPYTLFSLTFAAFTYIISTTPRSVVFKWNIGNEDNTQPLTVWSLDKECSVISLCRTKDRTLQAVDGNSASGSAPPTKWELREIFTFEDSIQYIGNFNKNTMAIVLKNLVLCLFDIKSNSFQLRATAPWSPAYNVYEISICEEKLYLHAKCAAVILSILSPLEQLNLKLETVGKVEAIKFFIQSKDAIMTKLSPSMQKELIYKLVTFVEGSVNNELRKSEDGSEEVKRESVHLAVSFCQLVDCSEYLYSSLLHSVIKFNAEKYLYEIMPYFLLTPPTGQKQLTWILVGKLICGLVTYLCREENNVENGHLMAEKILILNYRAWKGASLEVEISSVCVSNELWFALCIIMSDCCNNITLPMHLMMKSLSINNSLYRRDMLVQVLMYFARNVMLDKTLNLCSMDKFTITEITDFLVSFTEHLYIRTYDGNSILDLLLSLNSTSILSLLHGIINSRLGSTSWEKEIIIKLTNMDRNLPFFEEILEFTADICMLDNAFNVSSFYLMDFDPFICNSIIRILVSSSMFIYFIN
jgi:hypothetical protein